MTDSRSVRTAPARLSLGKRILFAVVVILGFAGFVEVGFRAAYKLSGAEPSKLDTARAFFLGVRHGFFEPWPYVGYRLVPGVEPYERPDGFSSTSEVARARTGSSIRIAFVGASTTHSGNRKGYLGSFPYFTEQILRRTGLPVEAMNCGVPGYSSAENLIHYELSVQDYVPDWVVIHQGAGDVKARLYSEFRSDYGHFRRTFVLPEPGPIQRLLLAHSDFYVWFQLRTGRLPRWIADCADRPLPGADRQSRTREGLDVFRRNTENLIRVAEARGAHVLLTTESHNRRPKPGEESREFMRQVMDEENETIRAIARERGIPLADTEPALDGHGSLFLDYVHLAPEGNRIKSRVIGRALLQAGLRQDPRFHVDASLLLRLDR